jgi:hypothetical protein
LSEPLFRQSAHERPRALPVAIQGRDHRFRRPCLLPVHTLNGTPQHVLQALGGWKDERMVAR